MSKHLGRGLLQSLRARADADVLELVHDNRSLRAARYGFVRRLLRRWIVDQPAAALGWTYGVAIATLILLEWGETRFDPGLLGQVVSADFSKDAAGFFLAAQVGILAVLTVAIGVVTLLTQRDDGSAINTDVRLYYVESYSYELATSGILLSIVLVAQLFWPLQPLVTLLAGSQSVEHFKLCVTGFHAVWLILNFYLFLHFIHTTLRFVEPQSRARLRKQYSANEIIPRDVKRRLLAAYYAYAATHILGNDVSKGPLISFGMGLIGDGEAVTEVSRSFDSPSRLVDVWLLPLGFALRRWRERTRKQFGPRNGFAESHWDGHLAIQTDFTMVHDGQRELVLREGGATLTRLERMLIGISFRFAPVDSRQDSLPTPTNFIEQLVSKVVNQIDAGLPNGFDDALKETVDFHSFALDAQNTRDESGGLINLAQVNDGYFKRPDYEWLREYRRAYTAAISKMTADNWFVHGMSGLVVRLWPRNPEAYPPSVLQNILDLGRHQVVLFEAWLTKQTNSAAPEGAAAPELAGSDMRAYEDALIQFISSWETVEQLIVSSFEVRQSLRAGDEAHWTAAATSWPSLQTHMRNTAYFLAAAVWNEDLAGSDRLRDLLVRWVQIFYAQLQNLYPFRDALMLTPDLLHAPWPDAQAAAVRTLVFPQSPLSARPVFGVVLREAYHDALAITGAVLLHWFATKQQPSTSTAQTAVLTLRRETLPGGGNTLLDEASSKKPVFRLVFDLLVREALRSRFDETRYSAYLDGLIRLLNEMATPRMVPCRIYGGFVLDGFQTLTPEFLGILAGNLPAEGDSAIADLIDRLLNNHPEFQDDQLLRHFGYQFGRYAAALDGEPDERFKATVTCFEGSANVAELRRRLKEIFDGIVTAIDQRRLKRMREAPLDEARLNVVRDAVGSALLANARPVGAFAPVAVSRTDQIIQARDATFSEMSRGSFTEPEMSAITFDELPPLFVQFAGSYLRNIIWSELRKRPKTVEKFNIEDGSVAFLGRVIDLASEGEFGEELVLLVPNLPFGNAVQMTTMGYPQDGLASLELTRVDGSQGGIGCVYAGTLGNIDIYIWQFPDAAVLCSRTLLTAVRFGRVHDIDAIFDFELFDSGEPTKSSVRMWLAPEFDWEDRHHIQFELQSPVDPTFGDDADHDLGDVT